MATTKKAATFITPQLATLTDVAPSGKQWWFETKYDGYRMQCHLLPGRVVFLTRNGLDWTDRFPSMAALLRCTLSNLRCVLDGEIVVHGVGGRSSFHALQRSLSETSTEKARFFIFDVLMLNGQDLRALPFSERRKILAPLSEALADTSLISISRPLRGPGSAALARACKRGEEGIIGKRVDAPYESGRTHSWVKVKCGRRQEFVVIGFSEPQGGRSGMGALLLGVYDQSRQLRDAGRVGTGFSDEELVALRRKLERIEVKASPLSSSDAESDTVRKRESGRVHWVRPTVVVEVSFSEWTPDGLLRHPVFQGLREDKKATSVRRESDLFLPRK